MTLHLTIVADVFRNEAQARHALEALRQAGFGYDQIGIAMQGHEGINLRSDLENLGVSPEQASYYAQEVKAGHTVISVRPDGREQEAHEIMRRSGAFADAESPVSQASDSEKQKAAWDQAIASHQAYLAEQRASKRQEDFHQPRSLKPRVEGVSVTIQHARAEEVTLAAEQKLSGTSLEEQEETTEKKLHVASQMQQEEVTEQKTSDTPIVRNIEVEQQEPDDALMIQNEPVLEQQTHAEEEHPERVSTVDEETTKHLRSNEQDGVEAFSPQTQVDHQGNRTWVKNGVLLGGAVLGLAAGVLVVLLRGEQIRQFVLSIPRMMKAKRSLPLTMKR